MEKNYKDMAMLPLTKEEFVGFAGDLINATAELEDEIAVCGFGKEYTDLRDKENFLVDRLYYQAMKLFFEMPIPPKYEEEVEEYKQQGGN